MNHSNSQAEGDNSGSLGLRSKAPAAETSEPDDDNDDDYDDDDDDGAEESGERRTDPDASGHAPSPSIVSGMEPFPVGSNRASGDLIGSRLQAKCVSLLQQQEHKDRQRKQHEQGADDEEEEDIEVEHRSTPLDFLMASVQSQATALHQQEEPPYGRNALVVSPAQSGNSNASSAGSLAAGSSPQDADGHGPMYHCSQCQATFTNRDQYERHEQLHTPSALVVSSTFSSELAPRFLLIVSLSGSSY